MAKMINFFRAHKRASVIFFSWVAFFTFVLIPNWREGPFYFLFFSALFVSMIGSQVFWIPRVVGVGEPFILGQSARVCLRIMVGVVYLFFFACNFGIWNIPGGDSTHLTLRSALLDGAWWVWLVRSRACFALLMVFWTVDRASRRTACGYRQMRKAPAGPCAATTPTPI